MNTRPGSAAGASAPWAASASNSRQRTMAGGFMAEVILQAESWPSNRDRRRAYVVAQGSTDPAQGCGLDRIDERAPLAPACHPLALERLVPFCLTVGVIDPQQCGIVLQALILQVDHVAVLPQKPARAGSDERRGQRENRMI